MVVEIATTLDKINDGDDADADDDDDDDNNNNTNNNNHIIIIICKIEKPEEYIFKNIMDLVS